MRALVVIVISIQILREYAYIENIMNHEKGKIYVDTLERVVNYNL